MNKNIDNEVNKENNQLNDDREVVENIDTEEVSLEEASISLAPETNQEEEILDNDKIKSLEEALSETKDKLLRALAENENIRKQMDKTCVRPRNKGSFS